MSIYIKEIPDDDDHPEQDIRTFVERTLAIRHFKIIDSWPADSGDGIYLQMNLTNNLQETIVVTISTAGISEITVQTILAYLLVHYGTEE